MGTLVSPRWPTSPATCSNAFPGSFSTPNSAGSWPMMIVSASPTMKPLSTGSEMNAAMNPSRRSPARMPTTPVTTASAAVNAMYSAPPPARPPRIPADRAAVADMGPTTRCRELPTTA
ncbi:hypothetical protein BJF90_19590 [Pseudonocardia sp. CNS-004]|nr:hypothetical protein BJF90_19590 [Pseudonocardia sp. CNS-004]